MFDPALAIDPVFDAFGIPVIVQETVPRTITGLRRVVDDDLALRMGRDILTTPWVLEIRRADMTGIAPKTRLLVDGEMREVSGAPLYRDGDRLVAILNTVPVRG